MFNKKTRGISTRAWGSLEQRNDVHDTLSEGRLTVNQSHRAQSVLPEPEVQIQSTNLNWRPEVFGVGPRGVLLEKEEKGSEPDDRLVTPAAGIGLSAGCGPSRLGALR